jgi:hypothetical protein
MTTEQRLASLEKAVARWRLISLAIVILVVGRFFIGTDAVPQTGTFDRIVTKSIVIQDGDAWIDIHAKGTTASIAMMSAEHDLGNLRLHNSLLLDASKDQSTVMLTSMNHALVTRQDAGRVMNEAKKEGITLATSTEHSFMKLQKEGKPLVGLATESPALHIEDAAGKTTFEK